MDHNDRLAISLQTWAQLETLHDLTYFAKECRASYKELGVAEPWARYFGGRAAPMGRVEATVVTAVFYSFANASVAAAIPAVWDVATPEQFIAARFDGFLSTWDRIMSQSSVVTNQELVVRAAQISAKVAANGELAGHPLYAANWSVQPPDDPNSRLFHAATLIREYRGDCHNNLLAVNQIDGCQAHVLMVAIGAEERDTAQTSRGYTDDEWTRACDDLKARGLIDQDQLITPAGRSFRSEIEQQTNVLMTAMFDAITDAELGELQALTAPLAIAVEESNALPVFRRAHEVLGTD